MKYILSILILIGLNSCAKNETIYIKSKCPKFTSKLKIDVKHYNEKYALISWSDINNIEVFLKRKKFFNEKIDKMNEVK